MSNDLVVKSSITNEKVARYVNEQIVVETSIENRLRKKTSELPNGGMISSSDVGALLAILAMSVQTENAIEIGTFTGYTAMKIAAALPEGGKVICCDISDEWTRIGKPFWEEAKVAPKIDLRIGNATQTLQKLIADDQTGEFDFAFIDADKTGYDTYYEHCLKLVRPGGLIVLDNMLWDGKVADHSIQDETTEAIRKLNKKISKDPRVHSCLLTVGDGLMLAYVR